MKLLPSPCGDCARLWHHLACEGSIDRAGGSMAKTQTQQVADDTKVYERVAVGKLLLDAKNPRLAEYALGSKPTQQELLKILWQKMAVDELAMSIGARGYFPHEPVFVEEDGNMLVVIEENRPVAAVLLLLDAEARKRLKVTDLPSISAAAADELRELPIVRTTRKDLWQYLGFKHVNGPAKWGSYAKAQYIAEVRQNFGV